MNTILLLIFIASIFFLIYILSILLVEIIQKKTTAEAKKIVLNFIKECISNNITTIACYPVQIGFDEFGNIHPDIIEQEFQPLIDNFNQGYLCNCDNTNANTLTYYFKVSTSVKSMEEYELIQYCIAECEAILHKFIHKSWLNSSYIENLVAVRINQNILEVIVAKNNLGITNISNIKNSVRAVYLADKIKNTSDIKESWDS